MDDVAAAIADPVRRSILEMLRDERLPAGRIADRFPISRPAVSRHLRVLRHSGLVRDTLAGRQRVYELDASRFDGLIAWLAQFTRAVLLPAPGPPDGAEDRNPRADGWERRFDALETEVHRTRRERRRRDTANHPKENTA
jgi:DNA-binding transcriptional ArsR family regulator